jgi:hypothetical protein
MSESGSESVTCKEGYADLRGSVGAHSESQVIDQELEEEVADLIRIDVRGKSHSTVYVNNKGLNAAAAILTWQVGGIGYPETVACAPGITFIDRERVAHQLFVAGSSVEGTTVDVAACATI